MCELSGFSAEFKVLLLGSKEWRHRNATLCSKYMWDLTDDTFLLNETKLGFTGVRALQCTSEFKVLLFWFKGRHHRNTTLDVLF